LTKAQICLTGSAFTFLFGNIDLDQMDEGRKKILKVTKVYARAKPNDKARIVMAYQKGLGKIVSMCGDGANDCGALKQSDAGLSISQT
jgi:cation-transporting ATPase 13A3/4/5